MSANIPSTTLPEVGVTAAAPTSPTPTPYAKRILQFTIVLGQGPDGQNLSFAGGTNKLTVSGLRATVQIHQALLPTTGRAVVTIFGLTLDQINSMTKAGLNWFLVRNNSLAIQAGDAVAGLTTIFNGTIMEAYPKINMPNAPMIIVANDQGPNGGIQLQPVTPVSFPGSVPAATALSQILKPTGLTVQNNGVNAVLASPYFQGSPMQQAMSVIRAADCFGYLDTKQGILAIWPKGAAPSSGSPLLFSKDTGMIEYPEFMQARIIVRSLFNPGLKGLNTQIQVKSDLKAATGIWYPYQVDYNLSSEMPGGPWEMIVTAAASSLPG
jgi:hypothetical protein